jgi:inosine-uridine nucleoside N-ribohydrolase
MDPMATGLRPIAAAALLALALVSCGDDAEVLGSGLDAPAPVVIDSDMGADDVMALLYLLGIDSVSVEAVTVTGTGLAHCPEGGINARAVLAHVGFAGVPVACGPSEPLSGTNAFPDEWREGADFLVARLGLGVPGSVETGAPELLIETINGSEDPVHLLALGPLTNVALALEQDPALAENIAEIVIMGGAVDVNGTVEPALAAEWNVWVDPIAANRVLTSGVPITLVPLDATNQVPATIFFHEALGAQKTTPSAELVYDFFEANSFNLVGGAYFFWDPLAAVAMVDSDVVTTEARHLEVIEAAGEQHGATVDSADGAEVMLATGADRQAFEESFLATLNGGIPAVTDIPEPDLTVSFLGETCSLDGPDEFVAGPDGTAAVVVEVVNDTEAMIAAVFGLHPGADLDQLIADAAMANETGEVPAYWEETGVVPAFGASLTGGSATGRVDLVPGAHVVICSDEANNLTVLRDVVVVPAAGQS